MEKIDFESLINRYEGVSESEVLSDWKDELENWKKYQYNSIHILLAYLKFSDLLHVKYKREMFDVDKEIIKDWLDNSFKTKVSYKNLKDTNIFNIKDFYDFNISKDLLDCLKEYNLSDKYSPLSFRTSLLVIDSVYKYYGSDYYKDILNTPDSGDVLLSIMPLVKTKNDLKHFFRLEKDLNLNVNWTSLQTVKGFQSPISNLNKVFINYLKYGQVSESSTYFDYYFDKRDELLSKDYISHKEDIKFFLVASRFKKEDFLISSLKRFPKVKFIDKDFQEKITINKTLEQILLENGNFRCLQKYQKLLSLSDSQILSSSIRYADVSMQRTSSAIVSLLNNSQDHNDWSKFLSSLLAISNKPATDKLVINQLAEIKSSYNSPTKLKEDLQEYIVSKNYDHESLKNVWESFHILTLDNINRKQWLDESLGESLLKRYLLKNIEIMGNEKYSLSSDRELFFSKMSIEAISTTSLKDILSSLELDEKLSILKSLNNLWSENEDKYLENYLSKLTNNSVVNDQTIQFSNLFEKIRTLIIWMNPTVECESEISLIENKLKQYQDFFVKSLKTKASGFSVSKDEISQKMESIDMMWEEMRMSMLAPLNVESNIKIRKF